RVVDAHLVGNGQEVVIDDENAPVGARVDEVGVFLGSTLRGAVEGEAGKVGDGAGEGELTLRGGGEELDADADIAVELDIAAVGDAKDNEAADGVGADEVNQGALLAAQAEGVDDAGA